MKHILLTGAAGSVGFETLKHLIKKNYKITVIELPNKKSKKRLKPYQDKIKIYYGDINNATLIEKAIRGIDTVIHLAAVIPPLADQKPELTRKVNFYGTKTILEIFKKENPNGFFIYSSSVSIYGDRTEQPWIKVGDDLLPSIGDYYAITKIETEKLIREIGINYTIFRLTGIMGHPAIDPLMFHMPLNTKLEIASTIDTGYAFATAVEHEKELKGKTFNLGGGSGCRTTYRQFLIEMFKLYGLNIKYLKDITFAEKNFHCGYFLDSDKLNNILHFQNDNLESYYRRIKKETKGIIRFFSKMFSRPIIFFLSKKSEPYKARKKENKSLTKKFFK